MFRLLGAVCVALCLAACGGGDPSDGAAAPATPAAQAAVPQLLIDALKAAIPPHRAAVAGSPLTTTEAFAWAEANYPSLFPATGKQNGFYAPYTYRFYPLSNSYLGVATASDDVAVYLYGALTSWDMRRIGSVAEFTCRIKPASCVPTSYPSAVSGTAFEGQVKQFTIDAGIPAAPGAFYVIPNQAASWITVSRTGTSTVNITASAVGMAPGTYESNVYLQFAPDVGTVAATSVPVTLTVGPGLIAPAAQFMTADATSTGALAGSVNVERGDGTAQAWTASSSAPWLQVTSGGTSPSALNYSVSNSALGNLANFSTHTATVTISSAGVSPTQFLVYLNKELPYLDAVMPYGIPTGTKTRMAVHGKGFSQYTAKPTITGVTATALTVESDTLITFDTTQANAGNFPIGISNGASLPSGTTTLKVFSATQYKAGSVAVTGNRSTYLEDPVRKAIFAVGYGENALYKYQYTGSTWTTSALAISLPYTLGMSPDGSRLFIATANNNVKEINPDTLQVVATHTGGAFDNNFSDPLPASVDGRLWMPDGARYFDLATNTLKTLDLGNAYNMQIGGFVGAGNGSTVLFLTCYCTSPSYPLNQYYTRDASVTRPMGDLELWYWSQMNIDGTRVMQQWSGEVYDASYNLLGQLPNADANEHLGLSALSPDGKRIATLIYEGNYTASFKRIDIFDTTTLAPGTTRFAKVGTIPITQSPIACGYNEDYCRTMGHLFYARDGKTLFWVGNKFLQAYKTP